MGENIFGLSFSETLERGCDFGMRERQNRGGQKCGVDRAGFADGERADRNSAWHLHRREQRIESAR